MKILVVEDEVHLRNGLRSVIEQMGHEATVASDGEEGLAAVQAAAFDLIVSDFNMPRKTGLELHAALDSRMQARFLLYTGDMDALRDAPEGVRRLPKWSSVVELRQTIRTLLEARDG